ncbi:MAG TPA: hypothetical protein QGF58_14445 [Myxococcota bacterium]|nr:hypothetical protein [Myxococcota bacterium]
MAAFDAIVNNGVQLDTDPIARVTRSLDDEDGAWRWTVPAFWLQDPVTWFLSELLSLVHATIDLAPVEIRSRRKGGPARKIRRKHWDWRLSGTVAPSLIVAIGQRDAVGRIGAYLNGTAAYPVPFVGDFDLSSLSWTPSRTYLDPVGELGLASEKNFFGKRGSTKMPSPVPPAPTLVRLGPALVAPTSSAR